MDNFISVDVVFDNASGMLIATPCDDNYDLYCADTTDVVDDCPF